MKPIISRFRAIRVGCYHQELAGPLFSLLFPRGLVNFVLGACVGSLIFSKGYQQHLDKAAFA